MVVCLSQNLGHGDKARARRFYRVSVCAELALIAVLATVCFLLPERIVGIFSHNPQVIAAGAKYTGTMAYLYVFAYLGEVIQGFFRGIGDLRITLISSILNMAGRVAAASVLVLLWKMESKPALQLRLRLGTDAGLRAARHAALSAQE